MRGVRVVSQIACTVGLAHPLSLQAPLRGRQTWHLVLFVLTAPGERNCFIARASEDSTCRHRINVLWSWNLGPALSWQCTETGNSRIDKL